MIDPSSSEEDSEEENTHHPSPRSHGHSSSHGHHQPVIPTCIQNFQKSNRHIFSMEIIHLHNNTVILQNHRVAT